MTGRGRMPICSGLADLVAFGVPYLANPDLAVRLQERGANTPNRRLL